MERRIALIGIIVEDVDRAPDVNRILHDYASYIIGRMGVPYRPEQLSIISVVVDAPQNEISSLSGKLGMLDGVTVKTVQAKQAIGNRE